MHFMLSLGRISLYLYEYALIDMTNIHFVVLFLDNVLEPLTLAENEYFWRKKTHLLSLTCKTIGSLRWLNVTQWRKRPLKRLLYKEIETYFMSSNSYKLFSGFDVRCPTVSCQILSDINGLIYSKNKWTR